VDVAQPFRKALLLSLSNPKAILFFVSFFIQFVDPGYAYPGVSFLVLRERSSRSSAPFARLPDFFRCAPGGLVPPAPALAAQTPGAVSALIVGLA
jgi:leucine efflux protein